MPDDGPGADQHEHQVDELAKGLVGLPIRLWGWRIDAAGFHRKAGLIRRSRDVPWNEVTSVYGEGISVVVEGRRAGKPPGRLLELCGSAAPRQAVICAWREYADRLMERDGCLRGAWCLPLLRWHLVLVFWGVMLLGQALFLALSPPGPIELWGRSNGRVVKTVKRPNMVRFWAAVMVHGLGGTAVIGLAVYRTRRTWRRGRRWSRWELRRDGLAFWPDGERHLLAPKRGDVITPREARIAGEHVPLRQMAYPLVTQIALAMGERSGARVQRSASVTKLPLFLLWASTFPGAKLLNGFGEWQDDVAFSVFILGFVVVEVIIAATIPQKMLFHGRAMLERLGW